MLHLDFEVSGQRYEHEFEISHTCCDVELYENNGHIDVSDILNGDYGPMEYEWNWGYCKWVHTETQNGVTHWQCENFHIYSLFGRDIITPTYFEYFFFCTKLGEPLFEKLGSCVALKEDRCLIFVFRDYIIKCPTGQLPEAFNFKFVNFVTEFINKDPLKVLESLPASVIKNCDDGKELAELIRQHLSERS